MSFVGGYHTPSQAPTQGSSSDLNQAADDMGSVHIRTCWGVDIAEAMCSTFRVNHPGAEVKHDSLLLTECSNPNVYDMCSL